MADYKPLWGLDIFKGLTEDELAAVAGIMSETSVPTGELVFREDEHGDTLYVVLSGEVEITQRITEDIEKTLATIREGEAFGEMALVDPGDRSASARATKEARMLALVRRDFFELAAGDTALGTKVFLNLCLTMVERLRNANDSQRQAMLWGYQVSGATHLNFYRLISNDVAIRVELTSGKSVEGFVLKVEETKSGHELTLRDGEDCIHILPYHSIGQVMIRAEDIGPNKPQVADDRRDADRRRP